jgi:hypothetical protein
MTMPITPEDIRALCYAFGMLKRVYHLIPNIDSGFHMEGGRLCGPFPEDFLNLNK